MTASAILSAWALRNRARMDEGARKACSALLLATAAESLQFLLVAKHAGDRYLLPGLSLLGLNACAGFIVLRALLSPSSARAWVTLAGLGIVLAALGTVERGAA